MYRREILTTGRRLRLPLKSARLQAKEEGWQYRLLTDADIRGPYLNNVRFLLPYQRSCANYEHEHEIVKTMCDMRNASPASLLNALSGGDWRKSSVVVPTLWHCLSSFCGGMWCDLDVPLTMNSRIWMW
jgi:hypothetical protein